jgi:hypothetical protein
MRWLYLILLVWIVFTAANSYMTTPVVYFEPVIEKCIRVESLDSEHSCENLPPRYIRRY